MKKNPVTIIASLLGFSLATSAAFVLMYSKDSIKTDASEYDVSTVPTNLDLNDATDTNIRSYYSSLTSLDASERQGTNLLKNLKPILKNGQTYYSYGSSATTAVWKIYEIVDRDWAKSPASEISGYNASTKTITGYTYGTSNSNVGTNPYVHALYVNRDIENETRAWGNHNQDQWGINQEHIWAKSCGFESKTPSAGARGDIMHLWAGNGKVNGTYHSNYYYGYVDKTKSYDDAADYASTLSGNLKGLSKTLGGTYTVFEPQDSDKGDIARAIFYMVARYNYLSGSDEDGIDAGNPNLELVNELNWTGPTSTSYTSSTTTKGQMGILQDLLEWNRLDPPDEWEIHRNNLCYNNFTNNRNPFIDYPEWAEYIWGKSEDGVYNSTPTGSADPSLGGDTINNFSNDTPGEKTLSYISVSGQQTSFEVNDTFTFGGTVTAHYSDNTSADVTASSTFSGYNMKKAGTQSVTVSYTEGTKTKTTVYQITVNNGAVGNGTYTLGWGTATGDEGTYTNFTTTSGSVDGLFSFTTAKNSSSNPAYNSTYNELRLYCDTTNGNGGSITITPEEGVTITDAVITTSTAPDVKYSVDGGTATSVANVNNVYTISDISATSSLTLQNTNSGDNVQFRIKTIELTYEMDVSITATVDKTYYVGDVITSSDITVKDNFGNSVTNFTFANNNYRFTYSDASSGGSLTDKTFTGAITSGNKTCSLTVQVQRKARESVLDISDSLDLAYTGQSGGTYNSWDSYDAPESNAQYSGNNAGGNDSIQLRSGTSSGSDVHAGIVSTVSGGKLASITVTWYSGTTDGRTLNVYGKNTAYSTPNDLYDSSNRGTLLGTIKKGTSTSLEVSGSYLYVGLCSASGAMYLSNITITYSGNDTAVNVANYIMYEDTNGQCNSKFDVAKGYFEELTISERSLFMTSDDYVISEARDRFEAWAEHLGKDIVNVDGDYVINNAKANNRFIGVIGDNTNPIIIIVAIASLSVLGSYILLKRKKANK